MKKIIFLVLFAEMLLALPSNNPAQPRLAIEGPLISSASFLSLRLGYESSYSIDDLMESNGRRIDLFEGNAQMGVVTVNFYNRFDVFGLFGKKQSAGAYRFDDNQVGISFQSKYRQAWAGGAKVVLFEWGKASLGFGGRYQYSSLPLERMVKNGVPLNVYDATVEEKAWQLDFGFSYITDLFAPYIQATYRDANKKIGTLLDVIADDGANIIRMNNQKKYGMAIGTAVTNQKNFFLNFEARIIDEQELVIMGEYRF
ncbi:MAG TPA: hypothetical protein P5048_03545 [Chlamydiales bacterium]|nr:hypothetical protein [Chlamydiales bacterium]